MGRLKKEASDKFKIIENNKKRVFIIHYSCESFIKHSHTTPRISSIAIRNYESNQTYSFSINKVAEVEKKSMEQLEKEYDELEKKMLSEYFTFLNEHMDGYYVHWNMRDINYGFEALKHRFKVLGGSPVTIDEERLLDLNKLLIDYYGVNYIGHPRLQKVMEINRISSMNFLTGKEEAECFDRCEYIKLHLSTLKKVDILYDILNRQLEGTLKTNTGKFKQVINEVFDSPIYKILSVVGVIWTVISIPLFFMK
ncbi:hypothetical protein [Clostridium sporogenes]|uniref:hypothetical protein n=1 Tax=Clostridium sporogenes TaxID=1509 RepID=UPI0022374EF3|nr:hypothetical protein [Clostridium sporogenes]MCW6078097.1 hypothetical protein [Clostridium sporogenes]